MTKSEFARRLKAFVLGAVRFVKAAFVVAIRVIVRHRRFFIDGLLVGGIAAWCVAKYVPRVGPHVAGWVFASAAVAGLIRDTLTNILEDVDPPEK